MLVLAVACVAHAAVPAFPGAEGGGAKSRGGRGGAVIAVTNLNDAGPGSLRAACATPGPRTVVFRTGGTITLASPISITEPFLTIAGQTAPGGGILIRTARGEHDAIVVRTHDVILRFLRIRLAHDAIGAKGAANLMVDHCSVSWCRDENMSANAPTHDVTYSWILNAEALMPHACGVLIGGEGWDRELGPQMVNIDLHHSLFAHNLNRNPKIKCMNSQVVNNLVYDWQWWAAAFAGGVTIDFIGNVFERGPNFLGEDVEHCCGYRASPREILWRSDYTTGPPDRDPSIHLHHNIGPTNRQLDEDNWTMMEEVKPEWVRTGHAPPPRFARETPQARTYPITVHSVLDLERLLVTDVGASRRLTADGTWVWNRDAADERVIAQYVHETGKLVYDVKDVGGFPSIAVGTPYADADEDGMPDVWERARGLDPNRDDSAADRNRDGWTNLEEFLNSPLTTPALETMKLRPPGKKRVPGRAPGRPLRVN